MVLDGKYGTSHIFQVYIDNYDEMQVGHLDDADQGQLSEWVQALKEVAGRWGIPYAEDKRAVRQTKGATLGGKIDGVLGVIAPSAERQVKLLGMTLHMLTLPHWSSHDLAVLGGSWVFAAQFRRPVLSLLHELWQGTCGKLSPSLRPGRIGPELLQLMCLLPLIRIDLRARCSRLVSASDASESGGGVCISEKLSVMGKADSE